MAPPRVLRTYAPARAWLLAAGALLLGLLSLYLAFEAGRARAGFDVQSARREQQQLAAEADGLRARIDGLQRELTQQEAARVGAARERAEVARTIGELQAQVARQAQDLAFYRGLVGNDAQSPPLRITQLRVLPRRAGGGYVIRIVLGRPVRPEDVISGTLTLIVDGTRGTVPVSYGLADLSPARAREARFNFRYLQTLELPVTLPSGFLPSRITVEVRPGGRGAQALRQGFLWTVAGA